MDFFMRWYDKDPRISLAVGCLEKANPFTRKKIAKLIIQKAKSYNVSVNEQLFMFFRRWYDKDKTLRLAMEYFKKSPPNAQKIIAEMIIINLTGMLVND